MFKKLVAPSILNVAPENRIFTIKKLLAFGIKWIHYDIMDGIFVNNNAISVEEITEFKRHCPKHFKDAHLMVINPLDYVMQLKNKVDLVTAHFEAFKNTAEIEHFISLTSSLNLQCGLAIKPDTNIKAIIPFLPNLNVVLVMSVEPGAGGQQFQPQALEKIRDLVRIRNNHALKFLIQVDGGINAITGPEVFLNGADVAVAGTYLISDISKARIASILATQKQDL
ncbi:ribulose-phosphate 3-epimerase [Candidatus Mycoplasma pogonae]